MIIAITGMPLAGKASVRQIFENMGCPGFIMRNAVEEEMKKAGKEITPESLREFATQLRKERGRGIVGELCVPYIKEILEKGEIVVVDGVRSPEEIEVFKREFGSDFILVCVWAPFKLRARRLGKRDFSDPREKGHALSDVRTVEQLKWRDKKELSWGLGEVIALADYLIVNIGTKEDLERDLKKFLRLVIAKGLRKITEWS